MDHLEVPDAPACACIKRQQRIAEKIRPAAIRTVKVVFRTGGWDENNPVTLI
jgi:hypothetical protein